MRDNLTTPLGAIRLYRDLVEYFFDLSNIQETLSPPLSKLVHLLKYPVTQGTLPTNCHQVAL
jgi:hypothetical protein